MSLTKLKKFSKHFAIENFEIVTMGARGQVVIPADIRKKLKLKTGEKLVCVLRAKHFIAMIKMSDISPITKMLAKMMTGDK